MQATMTRRLASLLGLAAFAAALAGCAAPKRLYDWGGYQGQVYQHLKGQDGNAQQQILDMEAELERMKSENMSPPPGYWGHLGLLYLTVGRQDQAAQAWTTEKTLFPESGKYMDFLLNNLKKQGTGA